MAASNSVSVSAAVQRAAELLATEPASAERQVREMLEQRPDDPRLLLILGSARRRQGDPGAARTMLQPLADRHPKAAHTQYELGAALAAMHEGSAAAVALRRAVALKPDLAEAWRALGELLFLDGDAKGAEQAFAEDARASVRDPRLRPAADALFRDDLTQAEALLRNQLTASPDDVAGLQMLAEVYRRLERFEEADGLLGRCLALDPGADGSRFTYANTLFQQQKATEAIAHLRRLLSRNPDDPAYRNLMAACLGLVGDFGAVIDIYEGLLTTYHKQPRIWLNYGHALRAVGRQADAVSAYRRSIDLDPTLGDAYWSLANLKVTMFGADEEAAMHVQLRRPDLSEEDRLHLNFALGKALEDRAEYAPAFRHYFEGARIRRGQIDYDPDEITRLVRRSEALFTPGFFADRAGAGSASEEPIFIVGLPRSGSTLIEQILASHPQVEGTMELPDIGFIARKLADSRQPDADYPDLLAHLDASIFASLGDGYIEATRVHRKLSRPFFIDKMPNNFRHIGLIQLILPRARIIDARRHPLGACFSAFKQHFAQGQSFSYDLDDLGRYYRDYVEFMAHLDGVLPGRIHRVLYEDLVEDVEAEVRRLLAYCGLPFDAACLKFYDTARVVKTVSSEQVRRPIFRDGLDRWKSFEPWLGPLKRALGPTLDDWRR